jgi:hypothetical protein
VNQSDIFTQVAKELAGIIRGFNLYLDNAGVEAGRRVAVGRDAEILFHLGVATARLIVGRSALLPVGAGLTYTAFDSMDWESARYCLLDLAKISDEPVLIDIGYKGTVSRALQKANERFGIRVTTEHAEFTRNATAFEALIKSYEPAVNSYTAEGPVFLDVPYPDFQRRCAMNIRTKIAEAYPTIPAFNQTQAFASVMKLLIDSPVGMCRAMQGWVQDEVIGGKIHSIPLVPSTWAPGKTDYFDVAWLAGAKQLYEGEIGVPVS